METWELLKRHFRHRRYSSERNCGKLLASLDQDKDVELISWKYRPLQNPTSWIRLLRVLPSEDFAAPICCSLEEVLLDDSPTYDALSYAWGDRRPTCSILLEDTNVEIRTNLEAALRSLRYSKRERLLWADALCIDQSDNDEKSSQVSLMSAIYRKANTVEAWLGESADDIDSTLTFLANLGTVSFLEAINDVQSRWLSMSTQERYKGVISLYNHLFGTFHTEPTAKVEFYSPSQVPLSVVLDGSEPPSLYDFIGPEERLGAVRLIRRPWWLRLWVYQEFVLARNPMFRCGRKSHNGVAVCKGLRSIIDYDHEGLCKIYRENMADDPCSTKGPDYFLTIGIFAGIAAETISMSEVVQLIILFQHAECYDNRDKVFAVLGIAEDEMKALNAPDYELTWAQVRERLVETWLMPRKNLDILSCRSAFRQFPTWAPNWGHAMHYPLIGLPPYQYYSAGLPSELKYKFSTDAKGYRVLQISGVLIGTIVKVGPRREVLEMLQDPAIQQWLKIAKKAKNTRINLLLFSDHRNEAIRFGSHEPAGVPETSRRDRLVVIVIVKNNISKIGMLSL